MGEYQVGDIVDITIPKEVFAYSRREEEMRRSINGEENES